MKTLRNLFLAVLLVGSANTIGQETVAILPFAATEDSHPAEQLGKEL